MGTLVVLRDHTSNEVLNGFILDHTSKWVPIETFDCTDCWITIGNLAIQTNWNEAIKALRNLFDSLVGFVVLEMLH